MNLHRYLALLLCCCLLGCAVTLPKTASALAESKATAEATSAPADSEEEQEADEEDEEASDDEAVYDSAWMNILLLGADVRTEKSYGRTDSIIILSVNTDTLETKMTSLMRDTWVQIPGKSADKLNAANVKGGPALAVETVNANFKTNIEKYVLVDMTALVDIVDIVGGVNVPEVTEDELAALNQQLIYDAADFELADPTPLDHAGKNLHLTGNQALAYARIRYIDSDYVRTERQRTVLMAIAEQLRGMGAVKVVSLLPVMLKNVETNLEMDDLILLAGVGMKLDMNHIEQLRLPADGTFKSGKIDGLWKIVPNFEKNAQLLHEFIYGTED